MISRNALVRVRAAAPGCFIHPPQNHITAQRRASDRHIIHTIDSRDVEFYAVATQATLVLGTTLAETLTHICTRGQTVPSRYTRTPGRSAAPLRAGHGSTCVTTSATIRTINCEISANTTTRRSSRALQTEHQALGRFMASLVEKSRKNDTLTLGVLEVNRLVSVKLGPSERCRVRARLSRSHERAEIHCSVLVLEAAANDVVDAVWIGQNRSDDHGPALRNLVATRTEVEEHWAAFLAPRTARRLHARGVRRRSRAHRGGRWLAGRYDGRRIRGGTHGRARIIVATSPDQDNDAGDFAPELHGAQLATSPTGAQQIH